MTPKSPCIALHATGWQNGGRLNGELSVGIFVPWEHTQFLKLQGLENIFLGKNSFFAFCVVYISK